MTNTIIFDMDGVLFDTERISCGCWEEVGQAMGLGDLSEGVRGCVGLNKNDAEILMKELYGEEFPFDEFRTTVRALMKQRLLEEGLPIKEGVMEILDYLDKEGYIIGLASSTMKKTVMSHLEKAQITHYFRVVITGDMVKHSKPMPDIYLMACEELGVTPTNAIAIEDSPNGIRSAYRAGMKPIMVPDLIEPTPEIESMLYGKFYSLLDVMDYLKMTSNGA
ncbi:HAD family hydrolase [Kineothrix sp. MB12-C1]|uniref:HAD family hydrolase n=1 Tax=Kineothrix sp. MB12-C1 TaxID=3070215 RepID=UPI0027D32715|nr:HAD family phosphatase [Kineothrix sp. MB12-C1]WMC91137.1 HAD family phosphatase [Kineothrix sp. MB12-C1]